MLPSRVSPVGNPTARPFRLDCVRRMSLPLRLTPDDTLYEIPQHMGWE